MEDKKMKLEDIVKLCVEAQKFYCSRKGYPMFAPFDGKCYRCNKYIFGWNSLTKAATELITGCPNCCYSFCE